MVWITSRTDDNFLKTYWLFINKKTTLILCCLLKQAMWQTNVFSGEWITKKIVTKDGFLGSGDVLSFELGLCFFVTGAEN